MQSHTLDKRLSKSVNQHGGGGGVLLLWTTFIGVFISEKRHHYVNKRHKCEDAQSERDAPDTWAENGVKKNKKQNTKSRRPSQTESLTWRWQAGQSMKSSQSLFDLGELHNHVWRQETDGARSVSEKALGSCCDNWYFSAFESEQGWLH